MGRTGRCLCVLLTAAFLFPASAGLAADRKKPKDEAEQVRAIAHSAEESAVLSVKGESAMLRMAAFGSFVRNVKKPESGRWLKVIRAFAAQKGMFHKAALLLSTHRARNKLVAALAENGDGRLAAAVALCGARARYVAHQRAKTLEPGPGEGLGEEHREKLLRRWKRRHRPVKIPAELLRSDDPATQQLAVLAAAYMEDAEKKEAVKAIGGNGSGLLAARLLYLALVAGEVDEESARAVYRMNREVARPVTRVGPGLSRFRLTPPGLCNVCEALGHLDAETALPLLHRALFHADIRVQVEAARSIRRIGSADSVPHLAKRLAEAEWPVLVAVCAALAEIPDREAVGPLINRLARERGRFRLDLNYALASIVGRQEAHTAQGWATWWKGARELFVIDREKSAAFRNSHRVQDVHVTKLGVFYGLPIHSERICYVVDTSISMRGARIASLRQNLTDSIVGLRPNVRFNIVDFGGNIELLHPKGLVGHKAAAVDHAKYMDLSYATRSFDAMERAGWLAGVDTLYFLSDGAPYYGQVDDWPWILSNIRLVNRYRPLAIYSIDFDPSKKNKRSMDRLAAENAGLSVSAVVDDGGAANN
ncbi:MAG: HEAT repeat domain-containing protein [bacterium]